MAHRLRHIRWQLLQGTCYGHSRAKPRAFPDRAQRDLPRHVQRKVKRTWHLRVAVIAASRRHVPIDGGADRFGPELADCGMVVDGIGPLHLGMRPG